MKFRLTRIELRIILRNTRMNLVQVMMHPKPVPIHVGMGGSFMRKQPGIAGSSTGTLPVRLPSAGRIAVLSVSPLEEDQRSLDSIIEHSSWMLLKARDLAAALALLQQHEIAVVLLDRDLLQERWIEMLEHIKSLPNAPSLIVASRLADDHLWAEALNLGAWDVLAKPFDSGEVFRTVMSASQHWHDQIQMHALAMKVMMATAS